jgi:GT2 family glycosyltransferase
VVDNFDVKREGIRCSIIIPVYNSVNFTKSALEDLSRLPSNYEVIIVDNASEDNTAEVVHDFISNQKEEFARLVYIGCPRNLGFGRSNNKGQKHASGEYLLFLNNDIRVVDRHNDWPEIMIEHADDHIVCTQGGLLDSQFNFVKEGTGLSQTDYWYASGWCLCGSRKLFDRLILNHFSDDKTDEICDGKAWGSWNEKYFLYFEDGDLTWRAKELGIKFKEVSVPVHHFARVTGRKYNMLHYYRKSRKIFKKEWSKKP